MTTLMLDAGTPNMPSNSPLVKLAKKLGIGSEGGKIAGESAALMQIVWAFDKLRQLPNPTSLREAARLLRIDVDDDADDDAIEEAIVAAYRSERTRTMAATGDATLSLSEQESPACNPLLADAERRRRAAAASG